MSLLQGLRSSWRKNSPELLGFINGSLPAFVRRPGLGGELEGIPIYSYHVVDAELFEQDLRFLRRNQYVSLTLDELMDRIAGRAATGGREVVLTFDDGPRNFFDVAFPLLREYGFRSTAFVAPGLHAEHYGEFQDLTYRPMTWQELRSLHDSGLVSLQSHTLQSQYVPQWPAPAPLAGVDPRIEARLRAPPLSLKDDFMQARSLIEEQCPGAVVRHLCYPMYDSTPEAVRVAAEAGYVAGYGGLLPGRPVVRRGSEPGVLPRLSGEFLRRMPGEGRISLGQLLRNRVSDAARARKRRHLFGAAA